MKLFRNCREVTHLTLEGHERPLGLAERVAVRLHLGVCEMCRRFNGQVRLMDRALAEWKRDGDA